MKRIRKIIFSEKGLIAVQFYLVTSLIFALFVAAFAVQNTTLVEISFLLWRFEGISLVLVILGSAVFGALCVFLLGMVKQVSQKFKIKELESDINRLHEENRELKDDLQSLKSQQANSIMPDDTSEVTTEEKNKQEQEQGEDQK